MLKPVELQANTLDRRARRQSLEYRAAERARDAEDRTTQRENGLLSMFLFQFQIGIYV